MNNWSFNQQDKKNLFDNLNAIRTPVWRFQIDDKGFKDIWFDLSILGN